jgi:hypothetical protein
MNKDGIAYGQTLQKVRFEYLHSSEVGLRDVVEQTGELLDPRAAVVHQRRL